MFNDRSSLLAYFHSRRSGKGREMAAPGPDAQQLADMIAIASRTPDHGKLAPWRFIEIAPEQRADLAALLKKAWIAANPGAANLDLGAFDQFAHQAPTLVVMMSTPVVGSKIPLWEQHLSGGSAAMNLLHAAHAHGFVGNWLTGWAAFDPMVKAALGGGEADQIIGYFFFGTATAELEERPRPTLDQIFSRWQPQD